MLKHMKRDENSYFAETMAGAGGDPFLVHIIVDHDACAGRRYTLLRPLIAEIKKNKVKKQDTNTILLHKQ
jgi:hypothetical protein